MHPDAGLLLVARVLRNFAYGYLVVVVGIYLDLLGLTPIEVGAVLTASAAGSAVLTIGWSVLADRAGRRRSIRVLSLLMVAGGLMFVVTSDPWLLALAAFAGSLSVAGTDTGTFVTVDQSMLPQLSADHRRTSTFAMQNMFATLAVAVGSLAAGAVPLLTRVGLQGSDAYRPLFVLFAVIGLASYGLFLRLSPAVELVPAATPPRTRSRLGLGESRRVVGILIGLNVIDSLAGGLMVQSIVAYWFYLVWRLEASTLALLFFWMNALSAVSMLAAGAIARRIGLFNTMLLTHIPQGVFGLLMPFAPTAWLAMAFWLVRNTIGFAFFPVRLSYVMGIVPPAERSAAAGFTTIARNVAGTVTPALAGIAFSLGLLGLPFVVSGLMKLGFDALAFATLRGRRLPEERMVIEEILPVDVAAGE
jgi:MFS family permease